MSASTSLRRWITSARWTLAILALGGSATLLLPARGTAYNVTGDSLSTAFRHLRLFNNFTDPLANDNITPDPNFPGVLGAPMAVWKGAVEWGSSLHGDGNGDPIQPADLGSGGGNFDPAWGGLATGVGTTDDNIMSQLSGSAGGVLAFTEIPSSNGWRIRFYESSAPSTPIHWADGPDAQVGLGNYDIQGTACHEYGHALGLNHTTVIGATMVAVAVGTAVGQRSIEFDDIQGLLSIYGQASATKPIIASASMTGGIVTITGTLFSATGNQVWFTPSAVTATSTMPTIVVANVASTVAGTQIQVVVPQGAGPGDVLVKTSGVGNDSLSNAWPLDPGIPPVCSTPTSFCVASQNSTGGGAAMGWAGSTSCLANNFVLTTFGAPADKTCRYIYGQDTSVFVPFGNGTRCINNPLYRLPLTQANTFGDAQWSLDVNNLPSGPILSGQTWGFQLWYRDPAAGGANFNASDGLAVTFCP